MSKGAVSFALNDRPGVAPQTRDRILAAARELGWQPSTRARALSRSRAFAVGLAMRRAPELLGADPFFPQFLAGVESVLAERGSALVLQVVADDDLAGIRGLLAAHEDLRVVFLVDSLAQLALIADWHGRAGANAAFEVMLEIGVDGGRTGCRTHDEALALARALLHDGAVLVLDEPTTGLDAESSRRLLDAVVAGARGRTVVLLTHDPVALEYVDRVVSLPGAAAPVPAS